MPTRRRVLVLAEAANPEWVSVPLVGWSLTEALREVADVHLVTQIRNRDAIARAGWVEGRDFTAIDSEAVARPIHRVAHVVGLKSGKGFTMVQALTSLFAYPYFEKMVWRAFGDQIRGGAFDLVHRVTPVSPTANSRIARLSADAGVPFVMGPINGGVPWPPGFERERLREREWLSYLRGIYRWMPGRSATLRHSAAIIAGSRHTEGEIPARYAARTTRIPENAIDPTRFDQAPVTRTNTPLRGCFVGRLVPYKGPDILLAAAADLVREGRLELDIVGDGPLRSSLEAQARALGIADRVTFHGWVAHQDIQSVLGRADMLTFPSVREFGGGVVLEAMALGVVPVICDYAGPAELVDAETGIKVGMGSKAEITRNLAAALSDLADNPGRLAPMANAARDRIAESYTWSRKARQISEIYEWVLDGQDRPIPRPFDTTGPGR